MVAGAINTGEHFLDEPASAAQRVRPAVAVADMQHLAGIRAGREDRVIPKLTCVSVGRTLLGAAVDLADEAVQVDHQRPVTRPGASLPRAGERDVEHPVELADVPEGERAQERPQCRRGHHPVPEDQARGAGTQQVHVLDAVRAGEHPVHQRHHLAARQRRPRPPIRKPHRLVHQLLKTQPVSQRRRGQQSRVADEPLLVELHPHPVGPRRPGRNVRPVVHHSSDLLTGPQLPRTA